MKAHGSENVKRLLEIYLENAYSGEYAAIAIVMACHDAKVAVDVAGTIHLSASLKGGLELANNQIDDILKKISLPEVDRNLSADYVCFNVPGGSVSYDFLPWLIDAEMTRIRHNAPAPLKVGFWMGRNLGDSGLDDPARRRMYEKVVVPALGLIGAVEDEKARNGRVKEFYTCRDIVGAYLAGEVVPCFEAPEHAVKLMAPYRGAVTITLRECDYWPHRNSNLKAWQRFAIDLRQRGERVVFVRDTANADKRLEGFTIVPRASTDLESRMALYQGAKCNLFVSNGPIGLALFSQAPFLAFIATQEDGSIHRADTPEFWRTFQGIEVGEQFPWVRPDQRIVWAKDDYENIVIAWNELYGIPHDHSIREDPRPVRAAV